MSNNIVAQMINVICTDVAIMYLLLLFLWYKKRTYL
nr:MAG TPA: hypothetical protein [Caudoviricetes sp.]